MPTMPLKLLRLHRRCGPHAPQPFTRTVPALAFALLLAVGVAADAATLYKWTDANGSVVYSDQPPPGNIKAETISGPPPPANPNAVKEMVNKEAELKKQQLDRNEAAQKVDKEAVEARRVREACVKARDQVRQLAATQDVLVRINEKGERVVIDPETRQRERENVEKWIGQNCRP
jgi:hypothetical protein